MNTKKQNSGSNAKFYVVLPTLEIMLSASKNCKLRAGYANMEYSNFMKHCKMQTDLRINTYARCAAAFDMDVLLIHLPKGMIERSLFYGDRYALPGLPRFPRRDHCRGL